MGLLALATGDRDLAREMLGRIRDLDPFGSARDEERTLAAALED